MNTPAVIAQLRRRYAALHRGAELIVIKVPFSRVPLADAVRSYLFNSQLVTVADGSMALILPQECADSAPVKAWLDALVAGNGPIRAVHFVEVRESMRNGGGPACLRLRVVADPATVDARFLLDDAKADTLARVIEAHWPERIGPGDFGNPALWAQAWAARRALLTAMALNDFSRDPAESIARLI